jgi:transcriptional regulator with XRE-family HTH domain
MLKDVIETLGGERIAKACGVTPGAVSHWKRKGYLPGRGPRVDRRGAAYERKIAKLAGVSVAELRDWIEGRKAA